MVKSGCLDYCDWVVVVVGVRGMEGGHSRLLIPHLKWTSTVKQQNWKNSMDTSDFFLLGGVFFFFVTQRRKQALQEAVNPR